MATTGPRAKRVALWVVPLVLIAGLYAGGVILYNVAQGNARTVVEEGEPLPPNHLDILITTTSIDTAKNDLFLRVDARPVGSLAAADGLSLTRAVSLDILGDVGKASYRFARGDRIPPIDVTIGLDSGDPSAYPFDSYTGSFIVRDTAPGLDPTPTQLSLVGGLSGFKVGGGTQPADQLDPDEHGLLVTIDRAPVTSAFAVLILVLLAMLALIAATIAVHAWRRQGRSEIPMVTSLAAMLFATITLRNAMPGSPPLGAFIDILVFFWAVTVIACSLAAVVLLWIHPRPPPAHRSGSP